MANSELYGRTFPVPEEIIKNIRGAITLYPNSDGIKRAKFIINNKHLSYQSLKRIKNFFDNYNKDKDGIERYKLAGGNMMRDFIERTLSSNRDAINRSKKNKEEITVDLNLGLKPQKNPKLNEGVDIENKNAIIIIVNEDNEILLLKRSPRSDWGASRWGLVGGSIQIGETPKDACKREIKEETGIDLNDVINLFIIERNGNTEYVFACRYFGDNNIELNGEHTDYDWFRYEDLYYMDGLVPNLIDYLNIAFKNYN